MTAQEIGVILGSLGISTWIGGVIKEYLKSRSAAKIKALANTEEYQKLKGKIESLEQEANSNQEKISALLEKIESLKCELAKLNEVYETEKGSRIQAQQQLATINIAFDIIYIQLKEILDETKHSDLLNQLKKYIDSGTSNLD